MTLAELLQLISGKDNLILQHSNDRYRKIAPGISAPLFTIVDSEKHVKAHPIHTVDVKNTLDVRQIVDVDVTEMDVADGAEEAR